MFKYVSLAIFTRVIGLGARLEPDLPVNGADYCPEIPRPGSPGTRSATHNVDGEGPQIWREMHRKFSHFRGTTWSFRLAYDLIW